MRIKDVIHGEIYISDDLIKSLIQTFEFQRLRKIKQLGVTNYVFPGAEHTRYIHSLGVYHITNKILSSLKHKGNDFTKEEEISLKVAALLHDVGHGPLSHAAEGFFNYSHEDYTIEIIKDPTTEINKVLTKFNKDNNMEIIKNVELFIKKEHKNKALNSIISSTVDADRMDYLLRDSYYTGAVYGNVDINRLISYMELSDNKIVFDQKALHTLEDFILSRYHMFIQVFLNEKSLIYEKIIGKILKRVKVLKEENYEFKTDISVFEILFQKPLKVSDYIKVNDFNFMNTISNFYYEDDQVLRNLSSLLEKRMLFTKEIKSEDNLDNKIFIGGINDTVYSEKEPIFIKMENKEEFLIEEVSQIFDFCKKDLRIVVEEKVFQLEFSDEI